MMLQLDKRNVPRPVISVANAPDRALNQNWSAELFGPGGHVQRMEPIVKVGNPGHDFFGDSHYIEGPGGRIYHRRAADTEFRTDESTGDTRQIPDRADGVNPA